MKTKILIIAAIALCVAIQDGNCNDSRENLASVDEKTEMSGCNVKHLTDANCFRAHGTGSGRHQNTAKIKAQMSANSELSNAIQHWIKEFIGEYVESEGRSAEEYVRFFETNNKEALEKSVFDNIVVASKEQEYANEENMYNVYLVIEIKRKRVFDALNRILSADNKWIGLYDAQKMEALFKSGIKRIKKGE